MKRVLVVDDEPAILRALAIALKAHHYEVEVAATARQAIAKASGTVIDLIVLDLGLPDGSGLEVIRSLRQMNSPAQIIVLSAWEDIEVKVRALDLGADDYVAKPFSMPELLARIRVALRHSSAETAVSENGTLTVGSVTISPDERSVEVRGQSVDLTKTQFDLLLLFARHPRKVLTHATIARAVWGPDEDVDPQNLRVAISQLRKRIELDPTQPQLIRTLLGVGYQFDPGEAPATD